MVTWKRDEGSDWDNFKPIEAEKREKPTGFLGVLEAIRLNIIFIILALVISGVVGLVGGYFGMHMVAQSRHPHPGRNREAMAYVTTDEVKKDPAYMRAFWVGEAIVGGVTFASLAGLWFRAGKSPKSGY